MAVAAPVLSEKATPLTPEDFRAKYNVLAGQLGSLTLSAFPEILVDSENLCIIVQLDMHWSLRLDLTEDSESIAVITFKTMIDDTFSEKVRPLMAQYTCTLYGSGDIPEENPDAAIQIFVALGIEDTHTFTSNRYSTIQSETVGENDIPVEFTITGGGAALTITLIDQGVIHNTS